MPSTFSIIGAGRVGAYVSIGLVTAGFTPISVFSSDGASAKKLARALADESAGGLTGELPGKTPGSVAWGDASLQSDSPFGETIVVAVGDQFISNVDQRLTSVLPPVSNHVVLHTAGALSSRVFERLIDRGIPVGSFHPLQAFDHRPLAEIDGSVFLGLPIAIEGDRQAADKATDMAQQIGASPFEITPEQKPAYHLAAVLSSNFYTTILSAAADVLPDGLNIDIMEPLAKRALTNAIDGIRRGATGSAMTGPVARGDVETVKTQLRLLASKSPKTLPVYVSLSRVAAATAHSEHLLSDEQFDQMTSLLDAYSSVSRNQ